MSLDWAPLAAVLAPLAAAPLLVVLRRFERAPEGLSFAVASLQVLLCVWLVPGALEGRPAALAPFELAPGLRLVLRADALGVLFALLASSLWAVTTVYSAAYLRSHGDGPARRGPFYASFALCLAATAGVAFAGNLLTFVLAYEVLTLAAYPLVVHTRTEAAVAAGRKYLLYTLPAGQLLLLGAAAAELLAPGQPFQPGGYLAQSGTPLVLSLLFAVLLLAVGVKAGLMPLHGWLPAAMAAPVPVSALLHAVAVVKAGAFGVLRVTGYVFGPELMAGLSLDRLLAAAAVATIVVASLRALREGELKRRLAYSTVAQLSYVVLGAALGTPAAFAGAAFHMAAHGFLKISLFFCAGAVSARLETGALPKLAGAGRRMPLTFAVFTVASLGLAGLPLLPVFSSKWRLGLGAFEAGLPWAAAALALSGVLNLAYLLPIARDAFWGGASRAWRFEEPRWALWAAPAFCVLAALALGLTPSTAPGFQSLAAAAADAVAWGGAR